MMDATRPSCFACVCLAWFLMCPAVPSHGQPASAPDEQTLFFAPTAPPDGPDLVPAWEPVSSLAVALPLQGVFARPGMDEFMIDLIAAAARWTDVVVLHDEEQLQTVSRVIAAVSRRDAALLERLHFVPARVGTVWLRDYGPVFARDAQGRLCLLDSVYKDARFESRVLVERQTQGADGPAYRKMAADLAKRRKDDTAPVYLAQHLRQTGRPDARIVRPPAQVWGGDLATDGQGNLFISTETLIMHGGKRDDLDAILKKYYGAKSVTYLEPLPGPTVKHLDMFFTVVSEDTFFLASYDAPYLGAGVYGQYLNDEIVRVLKRNEDRLRAKFPDRQIVRLPMPPVVFATREEVVKDFRDLWYTTKLLKETPALREHLARAQDPNERAELERKITRRAVEQFSKEFSVEPGSEQEEQLVDQLIRENSNTTLEEAIQNYTPQVVIYKTYLNSVHLPGPGASSGSAGAVLVPRYSPDARSSAEELAEMEAQVQAVYEAALPGVEVIFINCDTVIQLSGALHCVTVTVPRSDG